MPGPVYQDIPEVTESTVWTHVEFSAMLRMLNQKMNGTQSVAFKKSNLQSGVFQLQHNFFTNLGLTTGSFSVRVTIKDAKNDLVSNYSYNETTGDVLTVTLIDPDYRPALLEIVVEAIPFS